MHIIQSSQNLQFKYLKRLLNEHAFRKKQQKSVLEGIHLIQDWQQQKPQDIEYIFAAESIAPFILKNFEPYKVILMADAIWRQITPLNLSTEALAIISTPPIYGITSKCLQTIDMINIANKILILEDLQDVGNLGSIIRTAAAANYALIIQIGGANAFHPKVLRAAMGGHLFIQIVQINHEELMTFQCILNQLEHQVLLTDLAATSFIYHTKISQKHIWVMGNEGQGISSTWKDLKNSTLVKIPQLQEIESLNVGHACAICLYESVRRVF